MKPRYNLLYSLERWLEQLLKYERNLGTRWLATLLLKRIRKELRRG